MQSRPLQNMTETTCSKCESRGESQWRIRLENESTDGDERASYRLCRGCWNELTARLEGTSR
jgi:hypothetical protein